MTIGGLYFHRKLQQMLPGVLRKRLRQLPFENGTLIPTMADLEVGARELVRDRILEVGTAEIVADEAYDLRLVDITAEEDKTPVVMIAAAFHYTLQQERAAQKGNFNIDSIKMTAAQRVIAEKANHFAAYGNPARGVTGLLNDPNVEIDNSSFNPYAVGTTPDQLADFVLEEIESIVVGTNTVEFPTHLLVPTEFYMKLVRTRLTDGDDSVLTYILRVQGDRANSNIAGIQSILPLPELRSENLERAGVQPVGTNRDRMLLYPLASEMLERHIEPTQLAPAEYTQVKDLKRIFPMFTCVSATHINYPEALKYVSMVKRT